MEAWTDERLDDLAASLRPLPAQVARQAEQLTGVNAQLASNTEELRSIREDLAALHRLVAQIGWGLAFAVIAAMIGFVAVAL